MAVHRRQLGTSERARLDPFEALSGSVPPRDQRDLMERPFFSLAKAKRVAPILYTSGATEVQVYAVAEHGLATIWDADVLIWAASQILAADDRGLPTSRFFRFTPYQLLTAIGRGTGARNYHLLKGALTRLQSTVVRTTIRHGEHWRRQQFSWINEWEDPSLVATRHDEITKENGPYIANGAMRTLRAIYNHARKTHRYLPADNPVDAIDWNQEKRRDTGMGAKALPGWFDELIELENPLRREFHLFSLLSGCRPGALKVAELAHFDLRRRILHIPAPKGGAKKAFDIPLSRPMMRCLVRAIRIGRVMHPRAAERWIFAADSAPGHLIEQKEERTVLSKWANDLRQTFRTIGQAAEVPPLDIHILMNHSLPGVNAGYITVSGLMDGHLRRQQERISRAVLEAVKFGNGKHRVRTLAWLCSSKIEAASERQANPVSPKTGDIRTSI